MAKKETVKKEKAAQKAQAEAAGKAKAQKNQPAKNDKKDKKGKKGAPAGAPGVPTPDPSQLTADQLTQVQIEEAIKESQDPSSKLRKIKSPLSVSGCLINLLILVVATIGIVIFICWLKLDHGTFNLWVLLKDMLDKFKITDFFRKVGAWFKKIFKA